MSGRPGTANERLHAAQRTPHQPTLPSVAVLSQHPPSPDKSIEKL